MSPVMLLIIMFKLTDETKSEKNLPEQDSWKINAPSKLVERISILLEQERRHMQ